MQTPGALPSVWSPAAVYFANHTSEQLDEQDLPTEAGQRCKVLRYIHTDGTNFVYRRGEYPDETNRSEKLYTSWRDAYDLGANQYMRWKSKQQKTTSARSKAQGSYTECSLGGLGHSLVAIADMPGTAQQQSTSRSRLQASQQGLSNHMLPGSWSRGQASAAAQHQQASRSGTTASAHAAAWSALPPSPPPSDGHSRLPNATDILPPPPPPPHQPTHVPCSRALAAAAAAAGSLTPPTGPQSGSCRMLNHSTITPANTYRPAVPQVQPQQQIGSLSEAALGPAAAVPPSAATPRHVMSGHKRLHETAALPASRLLSIPQPPSVRTKQLAGHSQRPPKTVPTAVNSTQSRLTPPNQGLVAAHALPPGMNSRSTSNPTSRSAAQANLIIGCLPGQHPDVALRHHSSEQHLSHQPINSARRWSAGPQLSENPWGSNHQHQQQMSALSSIAGSGIRAIPLHSCSSDAQEAAGVCGFLQQSVRNQAAAQLNQVPNFMAATDDWQLSNINIPPALQEPTGLGCSLSSHSHSQQQQQQQMPALGECWQLPQAHLEVPTASRKVPKAPAASQSGSKPLWDWCIQVYDHRRRKATSQRLQLSAEKDIGSGGCGEVMQVKVKLYGQDSLAAMDRKTEALSLLLSQTQCSCGAVPSGHQQSADCEASLGSHDSCGCSISMALKVPRLYSDLPADMRQVVSESDYKQQAERDINSEYRLMNECQSSDHIVDCYALGLLERAGVQQLCLLMELSVLGSVEQQYSLDFKAKRGLDDVHTQKIVRQVAAGVVDMHQMARTIHRDIKGSNLLLFGSPEAPTIKLCDFGICKRLIGAGDYGSTSCGTPEWMAPEQDDDSVGQDWRVDSFQLGLLVLTLRTGRRALWWRWDQKLSAKERASAVAAALNDPLSAYNQNSSSHTALGSVEKAFVQRCITADISRRPSPENLTWRDPYLWSNYAGG